MRGTAEAGQYSALSAAATPINSIPRNAILCVMGGFCIHLVLGMLYAWAIITAPVTSYLRQWSPATTYNDSILIFSVTLTVQSGMMVVGGLLSDRLGARRCCALGSVFLVLSMFLASFCQSVLQFELFHAVPFGIGIGLCYTPPIATSVKWLPAQKGIVTGIIMCGLGVGAVLFGLLCSHIVNPSHQNVNASGPDENYFSPNSSVVEKVPVMYRTVSLFFLLLLPVGCWLMSDPPSRAGKEKLSDADEASRSVEMSEVSQHSVNSPLSHNQRDGAIYELEMGQSRHALIADLPAGNDAEMDDDDEDVVQPAELDTDSHVKLEEDSHISVDSILPKQPVADIPLDAVCRLAITWHLIACFTCTTGGGMYLLGTFKTFAQQDIHDEKFLTLMGSFSTLSSSVGRIVWGLVSDRFGALPTLRVAMALFALVIFSYPSSVLLGEPGFALWTICIFFLEAANFAIYFPVVVSLFGASHAASNYGFVVTVYSLFFMALSYFVAQGNFDFQGACTIIGAITFIGFLLVCTLMWKVPHL